jgi:predicted glycogen debranching enzyme
LYFKGFCYLTSQSELSLQNESIKDFDTIQRREWLVTNGIGGYASGTVSGILTRKYHGLLIAALKPPIERYLLISKFNEKVTVGGQTYNLFADRWADGAIEPQGYQHLVQFKLEGTTPVWTYGLGEAILQKRIWMKTGENTTYISYYLAQSSQPVNLQIDAFANYRDHHQVTDKEVDLKVEAVEKGCSVKASWGEAFYLLCTDAQFEPQHTWYNNFKLLIEQERGYDCIDKHLKVVSINRAINPGELLTFVVSTNSRANLDGIEAYGDQIDYAIRVLDSSWVTSGNHPFWIKQLALAAEQFLVSRQTPKRPSGKTIIAGYHWFSDWSRDTMISLPGLTIDKPEVAKEILLTFIEQANKGILPTFFPDDENQELAYNNADASLWYFMALKNYYDQTNDLELIRDLFIRLVEIIDSYTNGTHHNIKADPSDGLVYASDPGWQLTWMDAKYNDKVFTARAGKPVEINALWYNALMCMANWSGQLEVMANKEYFTEYAARVRSGFQKFWNQDLECLYDVIDTPSGWKDPCIRPNQVFAISLPYSPITQIQQESVLRICDAHLVTPYGLRSLSPKDSQYIGNYLYDSLELRDAAYHQGTVWSWLLGPYAIAHFKVFKDQEKALKLFDAMPQALLKYGVGTLAEIFDGNAPFRPQGCVAQAWSVAETLRAYKFISDGSGVNL